ncbi:MAG TPA: CoA transferase [Candidatus Dormibacteraeota bacterium]|nr:CoA transferase [Candidatus Dormibacteraeota bacterium]
MADAPLTGIRVLDLATILAGPLAATFLGDFGADVIKVEHPRGDSIRSHGASKEGQGLLWKVVGRNKRAVTLDLSKPEGAELLLRLVEGADVLIENFRPGVMERWNLGWEQLRARNPRLVMLRATGFGQFGPYAKRPGFGTLAEAMSGFAAITGEAGGPPTLPPFGLADGIAGMAGAMAIMFALYHRDARGGEGQMIDLAIIEPILTILGAQPTVFDQLGIVSKRTGNRSTNNAPRNTYRTRDDRWVAISTSANTIAERVMRLVGHPEVIDQPWFSSGSGRVQHVDELDAMVGGWIAERDAGEVIRAFEEAGAAVAPIYDVAQVMEDPQYRALSSIVTLDDEDLGPLRMQNVLVRMLGTPGRVRFAGRRLGQDNEDVYCGELGLSRAELTALHERGIL